MASYVDQVLGVFAREPVAGRVKTRLAAATNPELAARIATAFLRDSLDRFSAIRAQRYLALTPDDAFPIVADNRYRLIPQGPGDLGARLARFFQRFTRGNRVVVVGSDSPTLPVSHIDQAFECLRVHDVVLGPATDGGYYLVGCRSFLPTLFEGIRWGSAHVLQESVARLTDCQASLALLPPWYDVDTLDDWHFLAGHLAALRQAGIDPEVPHTEPLCREGPP